ncbi:MAG: SusD/RagB family nutrient-binding outer membrane lipoprotein [Mucilaginibacter sp.]
MKKYISIIAVFFTIGISGCKKDYLSLEVNPNSPSVTTPQLSLAGALKTAADIVNGDYPHYGIWAGYWTPSGNYVPSSTLQQYQFTNTSFNGNWTDLYSNLTNLNNLEVLASKDASLSNYQAIAMIMKAYDFEQLVDNFNDVPYSQAFQPSTILFPAYDKGIDIYHDLGKKLDAAIALINKNSTVSPGTSDIVFNKTGNVPVSTEMTAWKKFANSLKLRLAIHVSTKASTDALVTDLASTAGEGYLDGTTEATANPGYANLAGKESPFYGNYGFDASGNPVFGNVYYRANAFFVSSLTNNNDPRLGAVYTPTTGSGGTQIVGNIFGDTQNSASNPGTSAIGSGLLKSPSQDAMLFSGAESLFLQAEAALNGYISGDPAALYQAGITASFKDLGLTAAQATTYYSQSNDNVGYATSTNKQHAIIYQKYVSLFGTGNLEAYNEYRRTAFPVLPSSIDPAAISATLPSRILYPLSELTTNSANLGKEGTINPFTSLIFWATR